MKKILLMSGLLLVSGNSAWAQNYSGQYTVNPYAPNATMVVPGAGNPYGNDEDSAKLYDNQGNFHGNINNNPYDPNSIANPYGQYGSKYSPDSINNPYGAGSRYDQESPYNPYGEGMKIITP